MKRSIEHEGLAMFRQDFFFHDGSSASIAVNKSYDVIHALDLIPVNGGIASQDSQASLRRQFLIQRSHQRIELLNECRSCRRWLPHFAPYLLDFCERHILSRYVTVQDGLIERIAGLEYDVVHLFRKSRVADERENEIVQILHAMVLRHGHDFVLVEG